MSTGARAGVVAYRPHHGIDAIDQYSCRLVEALQAGGTEARYSRDGLTSVLEDETPPAWIFLQYNPFAYGRRGFAPRLLRDARRVRGCAPLVIMVHEAWVPMNDLRTILMGVWQRAQLRDLLRLADGAMTTSDALARELGSGATHAPVAATIVPVDATRRAARSELGLDDKLTVALFGRGHETRALDYAEAALAALAAAHGADRLAVLNLGADAPAVGVPAGVHARAPGPLAERELSLRLRACDLVLLPFTDGLSTRRTTLMAALAHSLPVLGVRGPSTEVALAEANHALALTPLGDREAFARAAVELASDPERRRALGEAGGRLYAERFDWPHLAARVAAAVSSVAGPAREMATV